MNAASLLWILALQVLFGFNYLLSKTIVLHYSPLFWAALRSCFTAVVILSLLFLKRELNFQEVKSNKKKLFYLALSGIFLNQAFFLLGLKFTTSYNSALINTLIPICTLLVAAWRGHESITKSQFLGSGVAICGVFILTPLSQFSFSNEHLIGDLFTIGNVIAYSTYLVLNREFVNSHSPLWTTGWVFAFGSLGLLAFTIPEIPKNLLVPPPTEVLKALSYGLVGGTLIPYLILSYALRKTKSSTVALFVYLQPAIVGGLAAAFYDYKFTREVVFATFLIFMGVFIGTRKPNPQIPLPE